MSPLKKKNLILALLFPVAAGVLYFIEPLKSYNRLMLRIDLKAPAEKTWNWCPHKVQKIEIVSTGRVVTQKTDLAALCIAAIGDTLSETAISQNFGLCMKAFSTDGTITFLECTPDKKSFRTSGMIFTSRRLTFAIRSY